MLSWTGQECQLSNVNGKIPAANFIPFRRCPASPFSRSTMWEWVPGGVAIYFKCCHWSWRRVQRTLLVPKTMKTMRGTNSCESKSSDTKDIDVQDACTMYRRGCSDPNTNAIHVLYFFRVSYRIGLHRGKLTTWPQWRKRWRLQCELSLKRRIDQSFHFDSACG